MADDSREAARQKLDNPDQDSEQKGSEQDQSKNDKSQDSSSSKPNEPLPPMNVFAATGVAIFNSSKKSRINKPHQGETKRSFRLLRLLMCLGIGIASLVIFFGLQNEASFFGPLKPLLSLVFLVLAGRCFYVTVRLWQRLK